MQQTVYTLYLWVKKICIGKFKLKRIFFNTLANDVMTCLAPATWLLLALLFASSERTSVFVQRPARSTWSNRLQHDGITHTTAHRTGISRWQYLGVCLLVWSRQSQLSSCGGVIFNVYHFDLVIWPVDHIYTTENDWNIYSIMVVKIRLGTG